MQWVTILLFKSEDKMYYEIDGLCPRTDLAMGAHGFLIKLYPGFRDLVSSSDITQERAFNAVGSLGRMWLDSCHYDGMFDPDNCGHGADKSKPPGPNAKKLYEPNRDLRVDWGQWGLEHITVPGNSCGLDLDTHAFGSPIDGAILVPHNIDSVWQKLLLLVVFTWFANVVSTTAVR